MCPQTTPNVNEQIDLNTKLDYPEIRSVAQAAGFLRIGESLVRRYIRQGRLRAYRVGKTYFLRHADILEFQTVDRNPGKPKE